jgi:hypothetical protein
MADTFICSGCVECNEGHMSVVTCYDPEWAIETVRYDAWSVYDPDNGDVPDWFWTIYQGRKYNRIDGWRGYFDTTFALSVLASGWVTGDWGDVAYKRTIHRFGEWIKANWESLPAALYVVLESTSNIFSTSCAICCEAEHVDKLTTFLESVGFSISDLESALS